MAHAQKPDLVFQRNGRVNLKCRGVQFSRLLAAEVCASALVMVVMLDTPCSEVECKTTGHPLHSHVSPSLPLPCVTVCHQVSTELYLQCVTTAFFRINCNPLFGTFAKLRKVTTSFVMSKCLNGTTRLPLDGFSQNFVYDNFSKNCRQNSISLKSDKNNGYFTTRSINIFISRSIFLRMRNVSDKSCRENQNTHFVFSNFFFFVNRTVYEIMWENTVERGRPQMRVRRMCIACWITKDSPPHTHTHSKYVRLIVFPMQKWLHERALVLCYKYIGCLAH